jgi:hypothetical protein
MGGRAFASLFPLAGSCDKMDAGMASMVDDTRFPLLIVSWPMGHAKDADVAQTMAELASFYGRHHAVLHDGVRVNSITAAQRKIIAHNTLAHEDEIRRWVTASAAVAPSALTRGIVGMIQWLAPSPCPFRAFAKRLDAEEWLLQALRRGGLWRPPVAPISPPP